jgi:hypothetical protein
MIDQTPTPDPDDFTPEVPTDDSNFEVTTGHQTPAHNPPQTPEEAGSPIEEAKAAAMSIEVRALDGAEYEAAPEGSDAPPSTAHADEPMAVAQSGFPTPDTLVAPSARFRKGEWQNEFSGHKVASELARIEAEVRKILDERDPKRKRKLISTRRWQELEEDVITMKYTGRMDENILRELTRLVMQRHFLFAQLRFIASTRPTWNT